MNPNATAQAQARRAEFIRVLAETGSPVQARKAVGVTSRTVRKWQEDETFLDAYNEAIDIARDAVVQKSREMALAGSETQLSLWMRLAHAALRPVGAQVAVGVKVDARQAELEKLPPAEIVARINRIMADARMRAAALPEPAGEAIDVEVVPALSAQEKAPTEPNSGLPDDIEDLL